MENERENEIVNDGSEAAFRGRMEAAEDRLLEDGLTIEVARERLEEAGKNAQDQAAGVKAWMRSKEAAQLRTICLGLAVKVLEKYNLPLDGSVHIKVAEKFLKYINEGA